MDGNLLVILGFVDFLDGTKRRYNSPAMTAGSLFAILIPFEAWQVKGTWKTSSNKGIIRLCLEIAISRSFLQVFEAMELEVNIPINTSDIAIFFSLKSRIFPSRDPLLPSE